MTIIETIKGLFNKKSGTTTPAPATPPPTAATPGIGRPAQGPRRSQTRGYEIGQMTNGYIETDVHIVQKNASTLDVHILERAVETANGTIASARALKLICGVCKRPSDRELYCQVCSLPLCIQDYRCTRLPDSGEIVKLCPSCSDMLYSTWNPWRGTLPAPFSVTALDHTQEKSQ